MISSATVAAICDDVSQVYQMTCVHESYKAIFASEEFKRIAKRIRRECPDLNDREIIKMVMRGYSRRLQSV